jgi:Calcineurin-like phosphoesterase
MPDPTRLLRTLTQAIESFRNTPGRRGRMVRTENAGEVLAAGDLHGNVENFRLLLEKAQLGKNPHRHLILQELIHGPFRYPTGGDKSHQLVDLLAALKCQYPLQVHLLLGNHELAQWTGQAIAKSESELNASFREGLDTAYGARATAIYAAYLQLFAVVPLAVRTPNRIFLSHSLPKAARLEHFDAAILERETHEEHDLRPGGAIHALLWGRDTSPTTVERFLQKVDAELLVTGHIPCQRGFDVPNDRQLILDCMGAPACYGLIPLNRPLTHQQLVDCIQTL